MISYRKIGGIHWFAIGPYRVSFCKKGVNKPVMPRAMTLAEYHNWSEADTLRLNEQYNFNFTTYADRNPDDRFLF